MSGCGCEIEIKDQEQKADLYWLLGINAVMFIIEMSVGFIADSTALIADSLDMLADAVVYGVGIYAVGKTIVHKANAAKVSGYFQMEINMKEQLKIILLMGKGRVSIKKVVKFILVNLKMVPFTVKEHKSQKMVRFMLEVLRMGEDMDMVKVLIKNQKFHTKVNG